MKSSEIGAFEAKTRLSELLEEVRRGRTFVITRRGRPVAELRPVRVAEPPRFTFGCDRGRITLSEDFDAPLPDFADLIE
jgi:prevent-host-death family protein